jgi:hypothetical protein
MKRTMLLLAAVVLFSFASHRPSNADGYHSHPHYAHRWPHWNAGYYYPGSFSRYYPSYVPYFYPGYPGYYYPWVLLSYGW